jgi:hypothetical protein
MVFRVMRGSRARFAFRLGRNGLAAVKMKEISGVALSTARDDGADIQNLLHLVRAGGHGSAGRDAGVTGAG